MKTRGDRISIMAVHLPSLSQGALQAWGDKTIFNQFRNKVRQQGAKKDEGEVLLNLPLSRTERKEQTTKIKCSASAGSIPHLSLRIEELLLLCQCLFQPVKPHFI